MWARQVACLSPLTMSTPQFNKPSRLFKYAHQVDSLSSLTRSTRQVGSPSHPTKSPQRVDSLSPLTKLTYHLASPSCPTQSPLEVFSPCRLSNSVHQAQGGSPSQLFKHTDEVDSLSPLDRSAHQVISPSWLTILPHHQFTPLAQEITSPNRCQFLALLPNSTKTGSWMAIRLKISMNWIFKALVCVSAHF